MLLTLMGAAALRAEAPQAPPVEALPLRAKVTQGRVTWHFERPARVGRFVNGDFYVVGPVTLRRIEPAPEDGRNLSALNIAPQDRGDRAFDKRMRGHDPDRVARLPIAMQPGDMLVSAESTDKGKHPGIIPGMHERNKSVILSYSILTCLEAPVPPDTFRPGYCDRAMRFYHARHLQWDRLANLEPVEDTPDIDRWAGLFRQPWIDLMGFCKGGAAAYQPQYARETARAEGIATLLLNLDLPREKKRPLLINFVQYGIDLWSIAGGAYNGYGGWKANGGHGNGRKWAIVFAGMMLGDEQMARPTVTNPDFRFGQDMQTAYGPSWTGATVVYAGHMGLWKGKPVTGRPHHQPYEHLQPGDWAYNTFQYAWKDKPTTQYAGERYRRVINSKVWVGQALAIRLMDAEPFYAHDAFLDYVDRWMYEDDRPLREQIMRQIDTEKTDHDFRDPPYHGGGVSDPFVRQMWEACRTAPGMPPTDGWKKPHDDTEYRQAMGIAPAKRDAR
jgi:hypothetical protein